MSSRDRDIGRKWESGSAKRKRKAERTATNQVLSLNMMKFLNQTACGSTEPSESIASTSTQQTSEEPLENVPDALNTESERQADVELGSSSSQSKFDAENLVLTSSSQEDQIDIDYPIRSDDASAIAQQVLVISDPGLWTFPITDTQRLDIVRSGPTQQLNSGDEYYPKVEIHLSIALEHLHTFCEWIKEYRETGFEKSLSDVRTFSERSSYDLPKEFRNKRVAKKKRMFDYESSDEPIQSPKIRYQTDFFYAMIDSIITNMELRFTSFKQHLEDFGFLYNLSELKNMPQEQILKHCNDLHNVLRVDLASRLNYDTTIKEFSKVKSRKFLFI
ncbi:hypothetical protein ACJJTC_014060 [Scirpophaga incertulas]